MQHNYSLRIMSLLLFQAIHNNAFNISHFNCFQSELGNTFYDNNTTFIKLVVVNRSNVIFSSWYTERLTNLTNSYFNTTMHKYTVGASTCRARYCHLYAVCHSLLEIIKTEVCSQSKIIIFNNHSVKLCENKTSQAIYLFHLSFTYPPTTMIIH